MAQKSERQEEQRGGGERRIGQRRRPDAQLAQELQEILTKDPELDSTEIEVEVEGGAVTLRGVVDSTDARLLAEELVESVTGGARGAQQFEGGALRASRIHAELIQHPPVRLVPHEVRAVALAAEVLLLVARDFAPPLPAHELHQQGIRRLELREDEPVGWADRLDVCPAQEIEGRRHIRRHVGVLELSEA